MRIKDLIPLFTSIFFYVSLLPAFTSCAKRDNIKTDTSKNQYDARYHLRIKGVGWINFGIADTGSASWPGDLSLVTSGPNSVTFLTTEAGNLQPAFTETGGPTGLAATIPQFTFDSVTNKLIDVTNLAPDDGRERSLMLNPAITDSRCDPAGKTIYASYVMSQNGRPPEYFYDTLTYAGPR